MLKNQHFKRKNFFRPHVGENFYIRLKSDNKNIAILNSKTIYYIASRFLKIIKCINSRVISKN